MTTSLCQSCDHARTIVSGKGARFLLCELSLTDSRFAKYPPQPIVRCAGFDTADKKQTLAPQEASMPQAAPLCLDQFLKLKRIVDSGGQAKVLIQSGQVKVNGEVETRRRRKLAANDVIEVDGRKWQVNASESST